MAPSTLLSKVVDYYRAKTASDVPIVTPSVAAGISIVYTLVYVIPFYLSKTSRPSPSLPRDAPSVIKARIRAVTFSCLVVSAVTAFVARQYAALTVSETLHVLGWWPVNVIDIARSLLLVALLFLGPLFESCIVEDNWRPLLNGTALRATFNNTLGWRNYIAGPLSEEVAFRSALIPIHLFAKLSPPKLVFLTPLYFGIAHIHHFYEFKLTNPKTPLVPALLRSIFQFTYTSVFGWFAAFVFLRTGSVLAVVFIHSFCNCMGLPRFWGRVEPASTSNIHRAGHGRSSSGSANPVDYARANGRMTTMLTIAYYTLLVTGAILFYKNLWTLTESSHALITFLKK